MLRTALVWYALAAATAWGQAPVGPVAPPKPVGNVAPPATSTAPPASPAMDADRIRALIRELRQYADSMQSLLEVAESPDSTSVQKDAAALLLKRLTDTVPLRRANEAGTLGTGRPRNGTTELPVGPVQPLPPPVGPVPPATPGGPVSPPKGPVR